MAQPPLYFQQITTRIIRVHTLLNDSKFLHANASAQRGKRLSYGFNQTKYTNPPLALVTRINLPTTYKICSQQHSQFMTHNHQNREDGA